MHQSVVNSNSYHILQVSAEYTESDNLKDNLNRLFEIGSLGVKQNNGKSLIPLLKTLRTIFNGTRYVTRLRFKDNSAFLPDNYEHTKHRLLSLKNKLDRNKELLNDYNNIFKDYESERKTEKVTEIPSPGKTFDLPHRAPIKQDRTTTKTRIVFDGSAKKSTIFP